MHSNRVGNIGSYWLLYAFPPFSVIRKVLLKVKTEEVNVILITRSWPLQPWYSQVLRLSVTEPLILPRLSNILVNPQGQIHPKTSGMESFRQSLASEGISERAAELIAGACKTRHII